MPPKKESEDGMADKFKTLCVLMATADEFRPNFDAAASDLGIAQERNVTRKVNAIIEPLGYTMQRKKIVKIDDDAEDASTTITKDTTTPKKAVTKAKITTKPANKKAPTRKPLAKKIEVEESSEEESDEEESEEEDGTGAGGESDSPATKAIKEAMAGSDVTAGEDSDDDIV